MAWPEDEAGADPPTRLGWADGSSAPSGAGSPQVSRGFIDPVETGPADPAQRPSGPLPEHRVEAPTWRPRPTRRRGPLLVLGIVVVAGLAGAFAALLVRLVIG